MKHVLILAGGFATRLWPLTEKLAKPLIPVAGRPLISFLVDKIPENFPIIISTNAVFAQDFEDWKQGFLAENILNQKREISIFIEDSASETEKKGALAATALCIQKNDIQGDLVLLAGDNYFDFDFQKFFDFYDAGDNFPVLAAYDIGSKEEAKKFGVVVPNPEKISEQGGEVLEFEEKPENPSSTLVSTGAYIFPHKYLGDIQEYSADHGDDLGGIFEFLRSKNVCIKYFSFAEQWYDIGSFPAFLEANGEILGAQKIIENSVVSDENTEISGWACIEKNVQLENCILENCVVREGTSLKNVSLLNCVIGKNCVLENTDFSQKIIRDNTFLV